MTITQITLKSGKLRFDVVAHHRGKCRYIGRFRRLDEAELAEHTFKTSGTKLGPHSVHIGACGKFFVCGVPGSFSEVGNALQAALLLKALET